TRSALAPASSNRSDKRTTGPCSMVAVRSVADRASAASAPATSTPARTKPASMETARATETKTRAGRMASPQVGQRGEHVVARGDHLAVHLISALRGDQI